MKKLTYTSLKLKMPTDTISFDFQGNTIEILEYLPIEDKYDLIMIAIQQSLEQNIYNPIKLDMLFHLYLVFMYSNITFTEKQKEDVNKTYNILKSSGLMDAIIQHIPEVEYDTLFHYLEETVEKLTKQERSVTALIKNIIHDLPKQAQAANDIVENFNPEKYQAVLDFAKAANGGRAI